MKDPIILERVVNNIVVTEHLYTYEDLFKFIYDVLPKPVAMELDEYINQLELKLETVSTELELYARDIEHLENQLEELRTNTVKHGKWVVGEKCNHVPYRIKNPKKWVIYKCSICEYSNGRSQSNYCPCCGAKMEVIK